MKATIPRDDKGYEQLSIPDTVAVEPAFFTFLYSIRKHISVPASRAIPLNFFEEQSTQNQPKYLSGLSRALFATTFLEIAVVKPVLLYTKITWTVLLVLKMENFTHSLTL